MLGIRGIGAGSVALVLGAAGAGSLVGAFVAHEHDKDALAGATIGAASAASLAALLLGGGYAWRAARGRAIAATAAVEGASLIQHAAVGSWRPTVTLAEHVAPTTVATGLPSATTLFERAAVTTSAADNGFLTALRRFI